MTNEPTSFRPSAAVLALAVLAASAVACGSEPYAAEEPSGSTPSFGTTSETTATEVGANGGSSSAPSASPGAPGVSETGPAASSGEGEAAPEVEGAPTASAESLSAARALLAKLGLPARFAIGLGNDAYSGGGASSVAAYALGTKLDLHYMYLSGLDWTTWTAAKGAYVTSHAEAARANGVVPMFTLYQAAAWGEAKLGNFDQTAFMKRYWDGARTMFEKLGAFGDPAVVHLEPDLWGYAQKQGGDDPASVPMKVGSIVAECSDLPENVAGMGKCLVRLSRALSPKVAIGFSASTFGATTNGKSDATRVGNYIDAIGGADADLVVIETLDRDAGCFEAAKDANCKRAGSFYWDETNTAHPTFHDHLGWAKAVREATGKPLLWWQMPLGVPGSSSGWAGRYRDNRVRYLFAHADEFVAAGGIGAVFGTGAPNQTTPLTDNGQFKAAIATYAATPALLP